MVIDLRPDVALLCASAADERATCIPARTPRTPRPSPRRPPSTTPSSSCRPTRSPGRASCPASIFPATGWTWWCKPTGRSSSSRCSPATQGIGPVQILQAMIALRGIYERHQVISLNHGVGFSTAAIELILPTYGEQLGLKGKICRHWALNPHPTLIPAIESGWVESRPQLRRRVRHERLRRGPPGRLLQRRGRVAAVQPGAVPACGAVRDRHVHRLHLADGRRGELLDGHRGAAVRFGGAPTWATTRTAGGTRLRRGSTSLRRGPSRADASSSCRWWRPSSPAASPPSWKHSTPSRSARRRMPLPPVMIYGDDVATWSPRKASPTCTRRAAWRTRSAALAAMAGPRRSAAARPGRPNGSAGTAWWRFPPT